MKTLFSLYLVLAVILSQYFSAYFFSKGRTSYRKAFSALVFCISIYLFGYLMIINSSNLQEMIFWNQVQYFGLPFISVLWLTVALLYTRTICSLKTSTALLLFAIPVLTFLIRLTNSWHHFFYTKWGIKEYFGYYSLYMERGLWYYVNISYTILCLFLTVIIYFIEYLRNKARYIKSHFLIFLFASLLPLIGITLILFTFDQFSIDYSALIMPVSLLIISYGIFKYDFLDIRTLARETIFENNFAGMVVLGPGRRIIDYNKAAKNFFDAINISLNNYPLEQVINNDPKLLDIFNSEETRNLTLMINGKKRFYEIDTVQLGDPEDGNIKMLKAIRDVTEERKTQEKLKFLAAIDSLSGLNNRAEFMSLAQKYLSIAIKENKDFSLLVMDLDNFKIVNDTFGHGAGDEVIRVMGRLIKTYFRKNDIAGRIGGEEFAVVLKDASLEEAKKKAELFREVIADRKIIYEEQEISITVSIGVAAIHNAAKNIYNIGDILKMADNALYNAKAKGRNSVATFKS